MGKQAIYGIPEHTASVADERDVVTTQIAGSLANLGRRRTMFSHTRPCLINDNLPKDEEFFANQGAKPQEYFVYFKVEQQ